MTSISISNSSYSQSTPSNTSLILKFSECEINLIRKFLANYQLDLKLTEDNKNIPGSYWGDSEAGLIKNTLFVRNDTPIHSLLHETCHYICMDKERRKNLDTDAKGKTYNEENAVCYLQIILAKFFPEISQERMMQDMDNWGYSFRLGSSKAWFESDAEDARQWLIEKKILDKNSRPTFKLRTQ